MREIKFRAWNQKHRIMAQSCYCEVYKDGSFCAGESNSNTNTWDSDDNVILMQFTGLLDKNGKEIYEGDVILIWHELDGEDSTEIIEWSFNSYNFHNSEYDITNFEPDEDFTVIGNIYENPEFNQTPLR